MLTKLQTCLMRFPQGRHYTRKSSALNSGTNHPSWCQTLPCASPLIFKKAVDHTCSRSIHGCGNHNEGNDTECVMCLGAVTLRFYGNTPPGVTVTLPSFLSMPAIFWDSLGPVQRSKRCELHKSWQKTENRQGSSLLSGIWYYFFMDIFLFLLLSY